MGPNSVQGEPKKCPREPKKDPGGASAAPKGASKGSRGSPRGVQGTPNGALGSPREPKRIPRVRKNDPEVQVLYSGLYIERIVFKVWIPRFKFQVLYSKFYIRGVLYSKVSIPGVYSKFHKNDPGRYSKIGFQDLYFECYIPSSVFEGCYLGFLFLVLYSGFKARWRGCRRQLDKMAA